MEPQKQAPLMPMEVAPPVNMLDTARQQVIEAFKTDIKSESVLLIHGTCLSTVNRALETGIIPGGFPNTGWGESYLHLYNIPERYSFESANCALPKDGKEALEGAEFYARTNSLYFDVCANLKVDPSRPEVYRAIEIIWDAGAWRQDHASIYEQAGIGKADVARVADFLNSKQTHNMVTLGFSKELLTEFTIQEASKNDDGLRTATPNGIPIKFLHSIEPLTSHAYNYLDSLSQPENSISLSRASLPPVR